MNTILRIWWYYRTEPENRDFSTYEFYRDRQDFITPSSLLFFQTDWDYSVSNVFHNIFDMPEPRFEYDFPKSYERPPAWFPIKKAFNTYVFFMQKQIYLPLHIRRVFTNLKHL